MAILSTGIGEQIATTTPRTGLGVSFWGLYGRANAMLPKLFQEETSQVPVCLQVLCLLKALVGPGPCLSGIQ